jgi:hypothetical protein
MRPTLLYYETMAVQWVSDGLSRFFDDIGYRMVADTVQEIREALVPLDRIYAARRNNELLVFALQFKAPYQRGDIICWKLSANQHSTLSQDYFSRFIWYCFPFMKQITSHRNALYHSHFVCPSICQHRVNWFMWDDYFLYFYPGGGGCNRFLEQLRDLPCGPVPYRILDTKLRRASRNRWNYTMNYDSWGSLFYKLLRSEVGFAIRSDADYEDLVRHIGGGDIRPLDDQAIIITVDIVNRTIDAINVIAAPRESQEFSEEGGMFPMEPREEREE